eukprot:GHVS01099257.1.p2 GENE.GHVS01099257.1~~GHVS01099257.1.p2  ORF type:complete len:656 (+),score=158.18 GHVS01099257.1:226-2193(+)
MAKSKYTGAHPWGSSRLSADTTMSTSPTSSSCSAHFHEVKTSGDTECCSSTLPSSPVSPADTTDTTPGSRINNVDKPEELKEEEVFEEEELESRWRELEEQEALAEVARAEKRRNRIASKGGGDVDGRTEGEFKHKERSSVKKPKKHVTVIDVTEIPTSCLEISTLHSFASYPSISFLSSVSPESFLSRPAEDYGMTKYIMKTGKPWSARTSLILDQPGDLMPWGTTTFINWRVYTEGGELVKAFWDDAGGCSMKLGDDQHQAGWHEALRGFQVDEEAFLELGSFWGFQEKTILIVGTSVKSVSGKCWVRLKLNRVEFTQQTKMREAGNSELRKAELLLEQGREAAKEEKWKDALKRLNGCVAVTKQGMKAFAFDLGRQDGGGEGEDKKRRKHEKHRNEKRTEEDEDGKGGDDGRRAAAALEEGVMASRLLGLRLRAMRNRLVVMHKAGKWEALRKAAAEMLKEVEVGEALWGKNGVLGGDDELRYDENITHNEQNQEGNKIEDSVHHVSDNDDAAVVDTAAAQSRLGGSSSIDCDIVGNDGRSNLGRNFSLNELRLSAIYFEGLSLECDGKYQDAVDVFLRACRMWPADRKLRDHLVSSKERMSAAKGFWCLAGNRLKQRLSEEEEKKQKMEERSSHNTGGGGGRLCLEIKGTS